MLSAAHNRPSTSQDSESKGSGTKKSHKSPVNSENYLLRKKHYCDHLTQSKFGKETLKTLCELLCKPVSVNITKLTTPGTKTCESSLSKIQKEDASMQKMKPTHNIKGTKRLLKKRIRSGKDDFHTNQANLQSVSVCKMELKNVMKKKDINQPLIKLHRIDEVINKIAQSLAKVTTAKEREANIHPKAQIELNESELESPASTTRKEKNLQKRDPKNTRSRSSINKISKTNESETSIQTEHIEEYQNESNLSVSESLPPNTSKGKGFQNHEIENTVSDAQVNKISHTNEYEANVEAVDETVAELNESIPKSPLLSTAKRTTKKRRTKFSRQKTSRLNKRKGRVQTKGIAAIQTKKNTSVPKLSLSSTVKKKDLQNLKSRNTRSRASIKNVSQTNECEESVHTESIEAQTELNASVLELSSSAIDKEEDLQHRETKNTRSRSRINRVSQTKESETHLQTECLDENQIELNTPVPKSPLLTTGNRDPQNNVTENIVSKSPVNKILQTNECEVSVQTENIEETQTELNAFVPKSLSLSTTKKDLQHNVTQGTISRSSVDKNLQTNECETSVHTESTEAQTELNASVSELSSSIIDKEVDLQNLEPKNTGSKSSIDKVSQTEESETNVKTKCMEEIQTKLNESVPKSSLLSSDNKDLQNDDIEIIKFISSADKILQKKDRETSMHTESIEAQTELNASVSEISSSTIDKEEDLRNRETRDTTSRSSINKISQTNDCETNVETKSTEEIQTELNASAPKSSLLSTDNKDLQNDDIEIIKFISPADKIFPKKECETSMHTECIEEAQTEVNAPELELPPLTIDEERDLQNRETKDTRSRSSINKISQTNECETNVETKCTEETQNELNATVPKSPLLSTDNKDLQNDDIEIIKFISSADKIFQANEGETSMHTECIEKPQTEVNAPELELPPLTIDEERDLQNRETKDTRSRSSINKISQTNECETNVETKCTEEIQNELNASVQKSPLLTTDNKDLQNDDIEIIKFISSADKNFQRNEGETSMHTECIEKPQTEENASEVELSSLPIDEEKDLQNRETRDIRSRSSINKISQTNECETIVKTKCTEDIQTELNASASKSSLLNTDNKDLQNDQTESITSKSINKISQTNESEPIVQTESIGETPAELDASVSKSSLLSTGKEDLQNNGTENITSKSLANKILQTNECVASVQRECTEGAQSELNASVLELRSPIIDKEKEDLQSHETQNVTLKSSVNKFETSVQTESIEEIQAELNRLVQRPPSLSSAIKNLANSEIESTSKSSITEIGQTNESEASVQTECIGETQTELNASVPKSSSLSTAKKDLPHDRTESTSSKSLINGSSQTLANGIQSSKSDSSDSEEICRTNNNKWRFKRIRRILSDSDNDSDNKAAHDRRPKVTKRLRIDSSEDETETSTVNAKRNDPQTECIDKNLLHPQSSQELNVSNELRNRLKKKRSKVRKDVRKNIKRVSRRSGVSSKLNIVRGKNDTVSSNVENVDSTRIAESVLNNEKINEPTQRSSTLDKSLIQKYKLFKELRAVLVRFDSIKRVMKRARIATSPNRYSATKAQRLIKAYRNSKLSLEPPKLFNYSEAKLQERNENHSASRSKESVKSTRRDLKIILCRSPTKQNYIVLNQKKIPIRLLSVPSKKAPSDTNKKTQQESSSEIQKACHNLSELFESKSKKSEQHVRSGSESQRNKKSASTTTSMLSGSPQISSNKTKEKSGELTNDVRSTKKTDIDKFAATLNSLEKKLLTFKIPEKTPVTKQSVPSCTSTHSPTRHKKPVDKKDSRNSLYKCIVCDLCFEDYSELQQHLIVHTQKQSNAISSSAESINTLSAEPETAASEVSKTLSPAEKKGVKRTLSKSKSSESNRHRKRKKLLSVVDSNECSICSQEFVNKADLAAHIFLHTERELQDACQRMEQKLIKNKTKEKGAKTKKRDTKNRNDIQDEVKEAPKKTLRAIRPKGNPVPVQKAVEALPVQTINIILPAQNNEEPSSLGQNSSGVRKVVAVLPKSAKEKTENNKKSYTICKCHSKAGTNENCLQIEIVLLCRTCKVLFRSVNCFESHYLLPEYENCNRCRSQSGKSPNLFCASCGMLFGSVQDVCHHLETHARFKKDCRMDFRCNICKVVFLGIGSLFYIHWSKHAKDSFWVADESSFPKEAILKTIPRREDTSDQNVITSDVSNTENYIHVAEYICSHCKFPFVTEDDLKKHVRRCDTSNSSVRKPVKVKLICSLCNQDFGERAELYSHMKSKHMLAVSTPQYFSLGQTPHKVLYICNLCIKTADNMEDFEDHWLNHNITNMFFNCMHCNTIYQNSLNSFVEHAREHESETCSTVYAIVSYGKSKFICTRCQIGFTSLQSLNTHLIIHKQKRVETTDTRVQVSNEEKLVSAVTRALGLEPNTSTVTAQPEQSLQIEAQTVEQTTEARSVRPSTESDKEKLLRILEENEDDSEHELVIDLTDHMNELDELGKGNQERQQASTSSNFVSDTSSIGQPCTTLTSNVVNTGGAQTAQSSRSVTQSFTTVANSLPSVTQNITVPASSIETMLSSILSDRKLLSNVSSCSDPLPSEVTDISRQLMVHDVESLQNTGIQDRVSAMNQEEVANATTLSTSKKQNSPKPKVGLLRVKTLAELRAPAHQCELCHVAVATADELKKHVSNHNVLNKDNTTEKEIPTKQFALYTASTGKVWNPPTVYTKLQTPSNSSASSTPSVSSAYKVAASSNQPAVKSRPTTVNNQQPQRLEANVNQNRQPSSTSDVTSAYHKNLPAVNVIRTVPVPRSSVVKRYDKHYEAASTTPAQNVPKTFAAIAPVCANERQILTSFIKITNKSNNQFIYKCKFCEFRSKIVSECLGHQMPGTPSSCRGHNATQGIQRVSKVNNLPATKNILPNDQSYKQFQPVVNQSGIKPGSSAFCYRYPYIVATSSANSNQMVSQGQQMLPDTSVAGSASASVYYKTPNHNTGGMSIVINQTTPSMQNLPTIGFLHQTPQQQMYQSQACSEPLTVVDTSYLQQSQSQNVSDFSGSSDVYQMANNQPETSNMQETVATYELRLPPGTLVCPHCLSTFISEDILQIHINTDHNFVCDICNMRFFNFTDLDIHKTKHTLI